MLFFFFVPHKRETCFTVVRAANSIGLAVFSIKYPWVVVCVSSERKENEAENARLQRMDE